MVPIPLERPWKHSLPSGAQTRRGPRRGREVPRRCSRPGQLAELDGSDGSSPARGRAADDMDGDVESAEPRATPLRSNRSDRARARAAVAGIQLCSVVVSDRLVLGLFERVPAPEACECGVRIYRDINRSPRGPHTASLRVAGKVAEVPRDRNGWRVFEDEDVDRIKVFATVVRPPSDRAQRTLFSFTLKRNPKSEEKRAATAEAPSGLDGTKGGRP
jgi:hypothetical protein